ncbi:syntaxin-7-like isoform X1 [Eriocheir sinensis]|uniref:syntaxin-7-like isoform X1 n=1 Tax=Eriocheir sinensis TaxID=95602 RepID=UPI0021C7CFB6|nr:syntaxin-7-like isoform X1 [Eriocheir sinensis]XP_050733622.1 syntaxin-7-like isoform X1 [Eriocheir sinensis]XP_050733623.1 syntaxin-7-like isoform X1 [Eriocheir sinensis]
MDGVSSYQSGGGGRNGDLHKYSHSIGSNIQKISQNVKSMQQLVNQLGTDQDNQQLRAQLHQVQHYTGGLAKDTTVELRTFKSLPVPPGQDTRTWHMQAERLTREFSQALNDFQNAQRQAASKEKEALKKARADSDAQFFEDSRQGGALLDLGDSENKGRSQQSQMQIQMEQEQEMQALQERESQIRQLEANIMDVNQIFKDLATMVHEQGEVVDSIEANVEAAQVHVSQASTQLSEARQYQNKARRKKVCLFGIGLVVLTVLILIIVLSTKN